MPLSLDTSCCISFRKASCAILAQSPFMQVFTGTALIKLIVGSG